MEYLLTDPLDLKLKHAVHRAALAYWRARSIAVGGLPGRQDIDPVDIPAVLPWINLIEVHRFPGGPRFRHRLVGTGIVEFRSRDGTGRWFDELYDRHKLAWTQRRLELVLRDHTPRIFELDLSDVGKAYWTLSSLILPLAADHRRVDMLMGVSHYS